MQKLKCESCGGNIEVEDNKEFATCPYCKTKYKLNETKNIYIKLDDNTKELLKDSISNVGKFSKLAFMPFIIAAIIIILIITIAIINFSSINKKINSNDDFNINNNDNEVNETINNFKNTISKSAFNSKFESYSGTQSKFFIESLLDNAVTNNKTNKDLLVSVTYKDNTTTNPDEIVNIKHSLIDYTKYEIKLDYDENGYVNKIKIEDL